MIYSVDLLIDDISNGYTLITIYDLKPWIIIALNGDFCCYHMFMIITIYNNSKDRIICHTHKQTHTHAHTNVR